MKCNYNGGSCIGWLRQPLLRSKPHSSGPSRIAAEFLLTRSPVPMPGGWGMVALLTVDDQASLSCGSSKSPLTQLLSSSLYLSISDCPWDRLRWRKLGSSGAQGSPSPAPHRERDTSRFCSFHSMRTGHMAHVAANGTRKGPSCSESFFPAKTQRTEL